MIAIPSSPGSLPFTVATGLPANVLGEDASGNLFTSSGSGQVLELLRTQGIMVYNGSAAAPSTFTVLSTGNTTLNLTSTDPDTTNFKLAINTSACIGTYGSLTAAPGATCTLTSSFTPTTRANYSNTVNFEGNAGFFLGFDSPITITQIGKNALYPVTVLIFGTSPANPSPTDSITLAANVIAAYGNPPRHPHLLSRRHLLRPRQCHRGCRLPQHRNALCRHPHRHRRLYQQRSQLQLRHRHPRHAHRHRGVVQLIATTTFTKLPDSSYQAAVTVTNSGTATASAVTVTGLSVGSANGSPLPVNLCSIAPGASVIYTFAVPASAGASGSTVLERLTGTYTGGTFGGSLRARLP